VRAIASERYFRKPVSQTFHGRDIFAPVAAHVAAGVTPAQIGKLIDNYLRPSFEHPVQSARRVWNGRILKVDRFGNVITNFHVSNFPIDRRDFSLAIGGHEITVLAVNYAQCGPGELFAIIGSSGYVEVSVGQGSAAKRIGCVSGAAAELTMW
jgi:S-adenosylmethionine hydrolase